MGSQRFEREDSCSKYGYQNRAHQAHLFCHFLRRVGGEVGGDRQFFEEGEVQAGDIQEELMEAQEDLGNEDGFGGDREQEEEEQPRRFGRRWVTTG